MESEKIHICKCADGTLGIGVYDAQEGFNYSLWRMAVNTGKDVWRSTHTKIERGGIHMSGHQIDGISVYDIVAKCCITIDLWQSDKELPFVKA